MSGPLSNPYMFKSSAAADFYDYQITRSLRFNGTDQALEKTWSTAASNDDAKAISVWIKRSGASDTNSGIGSTTNTKICSANDFNQLEINTNNPTGYSDNFGYIFNSGNNANWSKMKLRDPSAWYHLVWIWNSDESTDTDRVKVYLNGESMGTINSSTYWNNKAGDPFPSSGLDTTFGKSGNEMHIARYQYDDGGWWGGQMADFIMIDGTASISDFGETKNGVWKPVDPSGLTFGNNGFWLKFTNTSNPGEDFSGNDNDFTTIGTISTHDFLTDTPTFNSSSNGGNFSTLNPLAKGSYATLSEGNLRASGSSADGSYIPSTMAFETGKWYCEFLCVSRLEGWPYVSIFDYANQAYSTTTGSNYAIRYQADDDLESNTGGPISNFGTITLDTTGLTTYTDDDIIGIHLDCDNKKVWFSKNGSFFNSGDPSAGTNPQATWTGTPTIAFMGAAYQNYDYIMNFGQDGTFAGEKTAQGNSDDTGYGNFYYAPDTGFLAMCSGNLSAAGADPVQEKQPVNNYFQAITYTGDGNNGHSLTTKLAAASFWGKNRTTGAATPTRWWNTTGNNFGTGAELYVQFDQASYGASSATYQGVSNISATNVDVGNVGYINVSSSSYVAYLIGVAGAGAVTDTSGDIDSVRFTDADAGISIMDYTGSGTNGHTVPHGLGVKPSFVIIKNSTDSNSSAWRVWSDAYGDYNDYGVLNTTGAWQTSSGIFSSDPTTTMLPLASGETQNNSSQTYMAWVFANTEGMVKAGTYVGNGSGTDGTFVYTGFRPAFLMVKKTTSNNWRIQDNARDPYNPAYHMLVPNSNAPEDAYTDGTDYNDFLSNGFKVARGGDAANWNASGSTYIYLAFAEMPFKYATAK